MLFTSIFALSALIGIGTTAPTEHLERRQSPVGGAYTLVASRLNSPIHNLKIQAAGRGFYLGPSDPSTYCPSQVGPYCPNSTTTVLTNGAMYVMVPGGQSVFVQRTGALAYTGPHSGARPDFLSTEVAAFSDGSYRGPGRAGFAACPVEGQGGRWQVFAETEGFVRQNCSCFFARWQRWTGGVGAWQYT